MTDDAKYMSRALELAAAGRGRVEPNPMVGAVLVRSGKVLAEGFHAEFGAPHAEVEAINRAGACEGATLYVNLEPCNHAGKTPPCTEAILKAKISRVVYAIDDPNPAVAGGGAEKLRSGGVDVVSGVLEAEARKLNAPYVKFVTLRRSYVTAKWAMTLDGKIATRTGDSKWITCEAAREYAHGLRSLSGAVLVGAGTLRADDPRLTARVPGGRDPARCVIAPSLDVPPGSYFAGHASDVRTYIFARDDAPDNKARELEAAGCRVVRMPGGGDIEPDRVIEFLAGENITNLFVEGGSYTLGRFFDAGAVDRVACFIASKVAGGSTAPGPVGGEGVGCIADALNLEDTEMVIFDTCFLIMGILNKY